MQWAAAAADGGSLEQNLERAGGEIWEQLDHAPPDLVLVFVGAAVREHQGRLAALLKQLFGDALILGCSAAGVIGSGREIEGRPGLALLAARLPGVALTPFHVENADLPTVATASAWRSQIGTPASERSHFLLLADPLSFDTQPLLEGLDRTYPGTVKLGGLASGADNSRYHALYLDNVVYRSGLVGVALNGALSIEPVVAQGCRPIGQPLFVTAADGERIRGLDGCSPLAVLQELYQRLMPEERGLFQQGLFLGLALDPMAQNTAERFLIRNLLGLEREDGALLVGSRVPVNSVVQFHLRDPTAATTELDRLLARAAAGSDMPAGALLISCLGRGQGFYGEPDHDSHLFGRHFGPVPLGGFFANGEIGPVAGTTQVHTYTSAFALFRSRLD
ncbi:MAG: FIST N-terminal domain-containing protein [Candidatus Competibacterales bacterium]|nr:FIST N-terminal domain-containing protein [Candidatus Competibacterales bacterium]